MENKQIRYRLYTGILKVIGEDKWMVDFTPTNWITMISLIGAAVAGWILREFSSINKRHDNLSKNINTYIHHTDEELTEIKVDVAKIQVSLKNIEEMIKSGK